LRRHDRPLGQRDPVVGAAAFDASASPRVIDEIHPEHSQVDEILTLREARVPRISLEMTESRRRDRHENNFRYKGHSQANGFISPPEVAADG